MAVVLLTVSGSITKAHFDLVRCARLSKYNKWGQVYEDVVKHLRRGRTVSNRRTQSDESAKAGNEWKYKHAHTIKI